MRTDIRKLTRSSILLALAIVMQVLGRNYPWLSQLVVGSTVNAILIICLFINDVHWAILVGALTPILAWLLGQLPQPLGPIIPIIALGNVSFVLIVNVVKNLRNKGLAMEIPAIIAASLVKLGVIYLGTKFVLQLFSLSAVAIKAASKLMGISQLITALIGGFAAILLLRLFFPKKSDKYSVLNG